MSLTDTLACATQDIARLHSLEAHARELTRGYDHAAALATGFSRLTSDTLEQASALCQELEANLGSALTSLFLLTSTAEALVASLPTPSALIDPHPFAFTLAALRASGAKLRHHALGNTSIPHPLQGTTLTFVANLAQALDELDKSSLALHRASTSMVSHHQGPQLSTHTSRRFNLAALIASAPVEVPAPTTLCTEAEARLDASLREDALRPKPD